MIKLLFLLIGILVLGVIYIRKYMVVEKGQPAFRFFGKRSILSHFHHHAKVENHEVTVDEIIPETETVDPKKTAKADIVFKRGEIYLEKGDLQNAEKSFIQCLAEDPGRTEAYHKLGLIYLRLEMYGKAESIYRKLAANFQTEAIYLSNLGMALYQQKKLEEAKGFYIQAVELDGSRPGRFFSLGQILNELEDYEQALNHFQKALALDPKNVGYLLTLTQFYMDRHLFNDAKNTLTIGLSYDPQNPAGLEMMQEIERASI